MKKEELKAVVRNYGDAIITYRSENSKKLKYNVCTLDFTTEYIRNKKSRTKETTLQFYYFAGTRTLIESLCLKM